MITNPVLLSSATCSYLMTVRQGNSSYPIIWVATTTSHDSELEMGDYALIAPPSDGITSLAFSPSAHDSNLLLAGSWDSTLRIYDVQQNIPKYTHYFDGAILSCCYNADGSQSYCAGLDASVHALDHTRNTKSAIGSHTAPISSIAFNQQYNTM
jgi:WD40 repeat protein